jgi:uncharacterized membrane protein
LKIATTLVIAALFMVVGTVLIAPVSKSVEHISTAMTTPTPTIDEATGIMSTPAPVETYSGAVQSVVSLLPVFMVVAIILYVVMLFSGSDEVHKERREKVKSKVKAIVKNSKEFILRIDASSKKYSKYIQNLDELLGVETKEVSDADSPLNLVFNLDNRRELSVSKEYDWYIADKHPELYMFKVVGLHKKDSDKNVVYIIGRDDEMTTPYLIKAPTEYIETKFEKLTFTSWWHDNKELVKRA